MNLFDDDLLDDDFPAPMPLRPRQADLGTRALGCLLGLALAASCALSLALTVAAIRWLWLRA
jgi:hypothetical protein